MFWLPATLFGLQCFQNILLGALTNNDAFCEIYGKSISYYFEPNCVHETLFCMQNFQNF